jgi:hypothetical protein
MSTVYVTQETNHAFVKAEHFGEVRFLTRDDLHNIKDSPHNDRLLADLAFKLRQFNEDEDWLVITGSPYVAAVVFLVLGHRKVRRLRLLRWDNRDHVYIPLYIELRQGAV